TNLAQRLSTVKGVSSLANIGITAATMGADGWWLYSTGSNVTETMASGTTELLPDLQTTHALRIARPSGATPSGAICTGQTLDQATSAAFLGKNAVFSFYGLNGATQSATAGAVTVEISYSSGAAAAGTQATLGYAGSEGSKYAIGANGATFGTSGPTNQTAAVPVLSNGTVGTVGANGFATIPMSTTWGRYSVAAPIPLVIPGTTTSVTDLSVEVCFLPTATTAVATDWIELQGLQLEAKPSTATASLPNGVTSPSAFDRRPAWSEAQIEYSYWYYLFEAQVAGGITVYAPCEGVAANTNANCLISYPAPMRITPAVKFTDGFQVFTTNAETAITACTGLALSTSYATVANNRQALINCNAGTVVVGSANFLSSLGTTSSSGIIVASAL